MKLSSLSLLLLATVSIVLLGCGRSYDGPQRAVVSGAVSFNGQPLSDGAVKLKPVDSSTGRSAIATIKDGKYAVAEEKGPTFGSYRVEIFGFEPITAGERDAEDADSMDRTRQIVPARFNTKSELKITIDSAAVERDFELSL